MDAFTAASDDSAPGQLAGGGASEREGAADSALELGNVVDSAPQGVADAAHPPPRQLLLFDLNGTLLQKEWARGRGHSFQLRPGAAHATSGLERMVCRCLCLPAQQQSCQLSG